MNNIFLIINKETGGFLWYEGEEIQYVVSPPEDKEPQWPGSKEASNMFRIISGINSKGVKVFSIQSLNKSVLQLIDDPDSPTNIKFVKSTNQENVSLNNVKNQWIIVPHTESSL